MNFRSIVLGLALAAASASASAENILSPSVYACRGAGMTVSYTTSSLIGRPSMNVSQGTQSLLSSDSSGSQVYSELTIMGQLVSMFDTRIADANRSYTLVIPNIVLGEGFMSATFDTVLVQSFSGGMLPPNFTGIRQSNKFSKVRCTAQHAVF